LKLKTVRSVAHPLSVSETFYKTSHLPLKDKSILCEPYESHLEEKDKMKIFTGDSHLIHERKMQFGYFKTKKKHANKSKKQMSYKRE